MTRPAKLTPLKGVLCVLSAIMGLLFLCGVYSIGSRNGFVEIACVEAMGACFGAMCGIVSGRLGVSIAIGVCMAIPAVLFVDCVQYFVTGMR